MTAVPRDLIDGIVAHFHPRRIILFGSQARGQARRDSDYDFLVVVDDDTPRHLLTLAAGYASTRASPLSADVVPCRAATYERRSAIVGTLCHLAKTEGTVVYERR